MSYYKGTLFPEKILSSGFTDFSSNTSYQSIIQRRLFAYLHNLPEDISERFQDTNFITLPKINTVKVVKAASAFHGCKSLRCIDGWRFTSLQNASSMFYNCINLEFINPTDEYDCYLYLPTISSMTYMLYCCRSIKSLCIDLGGKTIYSSVMSSAFFRMLALTDFNIVNGSIRVNGKFNPFGAEQSSTTNSKTRATTTTQLWTSVLTIDSIVNFLNALADNTGGTNYTVGIPKSVYDLLDDEQKSIATNKNLTLVGE